MASKGTEIAAIDSPTSCVKVSFTKMTQKMKITSKLKDNPKNEDDPKIDIHFSGRLLFWCCLLFRGCLHLWGFGPTYKNSGNTLTVSTIITRIFAKKNRAQNI